MDFSVLKDRLVADGYSDDAGGRGYGGDSCICIEFGVKSYDLLHFRPAFRAFHHHPAEP